MIYRFIVSLAALVAAYLGRVGVALSQLTNTIVFFGDPDECVSGRAYRQRQDRGWATLYRVINTLVFWQDDHCYQAYRADLERKRQEVFTPWDKPSGDKRA